MTHTVGFPGLFDRTFTMNPEALAFSIGPLDFSIKWYGVIIACGFALAVLYAARRAARFGTSTDELIDLLLWALPLSIVGARLYYVLNKWDYYSAHPGDIIKVWEGGLAIYGGVLAAFATVFVFSRVRRCNMLGLMDIGSLGLLIGQIVGRWANFVNAEAYGSETSLPWGMSIDGGAPVHPTFLYESLWNLVGFAFLHFYSKKKRTFPGEIALLYLTWYGFGRFFIEGLRADSLYLGHTDIRVSQALALFMFVCAGGAWLYLRLSRKNTPAHKEE